ncbi:MAG: hypothetical protein ACREUZ_11220 [Burkholderiales bacterium]
MRQMSRSSEKLASTDLIRRPGDIMRITFFRFMIGLVIALAAVAAAETSATFQTPPAPSPTVAPLGDQIVAAELAAVQGFEQRVADFVALHRLLEGPLPPLQVSNDMGKVRAAMDALAIRIRAARKDARPGDLFTEDVKRVFHKRIAACVTPEEIESILAEHEPGERVVPPRLVVNMTWPEGVPFDFVPPQLIAALPPLPPELQYRIIGRSLVLWDHHADLIVDFMPGAFTS